MEPNDLYAVSPVTQDIDSPQLIQFPDGLGVGVFINNTPDTPAHPLMTAQFV